MSINDNSNGGVFNVTSNHNDIDGGNDNHHYDIFDADVHPPRTVNFDPGELGPNPFEVARAYIDDSVAGSILSADIPDAIGIGTPVPVPVPNIAQAEWCVLKGVNNYSDFLNNNNIPMILVPDGMSFPRTELQRVTRHCKTLIGDYDKVTTAQENVWLYTFKAAFKVRTVHWEGYFRDTFRSMTESMLLPVIKKDIEIEVPYACNRPLLNDNTFRIFIWSSPSGGTGGNEPAKIWGYGLSKAHGVFSSTYEGITICDDEGYEVAELFENSLYIHNNLTRRSESGRKDIYERILIEVISILESGYEKELKKFRASISIDYKQLYIDNCAKRIDVKKESIARTLSSLNQLIQQYEKDLICKIRERGVQQATLSGINQGTPELQKGYGKEYDKLCKLEDIESVTMFRKRLLVVTKPIEITYRKKTYDMGKYQITINLNGECLTNYSIRCDSVDKSKEYGGYPHPHVAGNGSCCFGNLSAGVAKLLGEYQFSLVVELMLNYLRSVYAEGWYTSIENWTPNK